MYNLQKVTISYRCEIYVSKPRTRVYSIIRCVRSSSYADGCDVGWIGAASALRREKPGMRKGVERSFVEWLQERYMLSVHRDLWRYRISTRRRGHLEMSRRRKLSTVGKSGLFKKQ